VLDSNSHEMLGRPGRFGRGGRVVTASGLQGWARLGLVCVIGLIYLFLYKTIPVEVPVQVPYEKWESAAGAARDKVRKTWNAKGVQDILNSTLGASLAIPSPRIDLLTFKPAV